MAITTRQATKLICNISGWSVSNLQLQKILYISHMYNLGVTEGDPLITDNFEAWDYGPVIPTLYHEVKGFGSKE